MNSEEITSTQTAWRFVAENRPNITKQTVPVPVPNDDEVLLKVLACGGEQLRSRNGKKSG